MRLFLAIPLPKSLKDRLLKWQPAMEGVRWQQPPTMHLTLRFIGDTDGQTMQRLEKGLDAIQYSPFEVSLESTGAFPTTEKPKILWIGVEKQPELMKLQSEIEKTCQTAGLEADNRAYTPHVTLGRAKRKADRHELREFIRRYENEISGSFQASEFVLYNSTLTPQGAKHEDVKRYPLSSAEKN